MSDNPYASPKPVSSAPPVGSGVGIDYRVVAPLCLTAGWLRLLGILNMIGGVLYCLTIIGIIVGWLPLWIGISLNKASRALREGYERRDPQQLYVGMDSLALVIKIFGVLAAIALAINLLYFGTLFLALIGAAVSSQM